MRGLVFFDVAGTLVAGNPWRGLLKSDAVGRVRLYGLYPVILLTYLAKRVGLISDTRFRQWWIREMALLLRGMEQEQLQALFRWIVTEYMAGDYRDDVVARLREHKAAGDHVILISGMFTGLTQAFADHLGADAGLGTTLAFDEAGVCAGHIVGKGCAGPLKVHVLVSYLQQANLTLPAQPTYAYADSYSDVPLLSLADFATATYPDERLAEVVAERGWSVIGA